MKHIFAAVLLSTFLATGAAHAADDGFYGFIKKTMGDTPVTDAVYKDMDGDGFLEALVTTASCNDDGCNWSLFSDAASGPALIGSSRGKDVHFEATAGKGQVVYSDGITWAYSGVGKMYPWNSLLQNVDGRAATVQERATLAAAFGYDASDAVAMKVNVQDGALFKNGMTQHVAGISGLCCSMGDDGYPYAVLSGDGKVLTKGYSIDFPMIFRDWHGGVWVVTNHFDGPGLTHLKAVTQSNSSEK